MELPLTNCGNRYAIIRSSGFLDQMAIHLHSSRPEAYSPAQLMTKEMVPAFGVPDALPSDRGTNLLFHIMMDVCQLLGTKLNTTAYHP